LNSQPRITIFLPSLAGGGAQLVMLKLAGAMAERGHSVDIVLSQATGPYLDQVPQTVRLIDLRATHVLTSLPALMRYLRHEQPVVLIAAMMHTNIVATWARQLVRFPKLLMITEHNTISVERATNWRSHFLPHLARIFYPWSNLIVAVSHGVADDMVSTLGLSRQQIHVIYNPVVTPQLQQKAEELLTHPWFVSGAPPVILGVGRLNVQKDFATLIRAFTQVRQTHSARLMILGEGEERPALTRLVEQFHLVADVNLPGFVSNPYPYMARATMFVLSSRWEGLPSVLIEALYCGATVISTDCPSGPHEILAGGRYGQLVPVGDSAALATAIRLTLDQQHVRPPADIWHPFEQEVVVDQYLNLLLNMGKHTNTETINPLT